MAIVRSYTDAFQIIDRTPEINLIPNQWGIITQSGIFPSTEGVTTPVVSMEQITKSGAVMVDRIRGERNNVSKDYVRKLYSFNVPHFPLDDVLKPEDIQSRSAYGTNDQPEQEALALARKIERIRMSHMQLKEKAFAQLLADGTVYSPNGTISTNFYTEFGITRKEIDFVFGTATTDIMGKVEEGIAHIIDNLLAGGEVSTGFDAFCSPGFFSNLIKHAKVQAAYTYYSSTQEPLRQRLDSSLPMGTRVFEYGGVRFIEYRGTDFGGTAFMTANEARLVPRGTMDAFGVYASPAGTMQHVNTVGQESYLFTHRDPIDGSVIIRSEMNLLTVARKPAVIVRLYSST